MNLTDIVPPLELCKLIPDGEFSDTALVFACQPDDDDGEEINVFTRDMIEHLETRLGGTPYTLYPAPTLQEILASMPHCSCRHDHLGWTTSSFYVEGNKPEFGSNPTAVMKLFLKLKGIYHE